MAVAEPVVAAEAPVILTISANPVKAVPALTVLAFLTVVILV